MAKLWRSIASTFALGRMPLTPSRFDGICVAVPIDR